MKKEIPFFAIGNNELDNLSEVGKVAICPNCKKKHKVKYGKIKNKEGVWEKSKMLGFVDCGTKNYMVSINGKLLN